MIIFLWVVHIPQQPAIAPVQPVQAQKPVVEVAVSYSLSKTEY